MAIISLSKEFMIDKCLVMPLFDIMSDIPEKIKDNKSSLSVPIFKQDIPISGYIQDVTFSVYQDTQGEKNIFLKIVKIGKNTIKSSSLNDLLIKELFVHDRISLKHKELSLTSSNPDLKGFGITIEDAMQGKNSKAKLVAKSQTPTQKTKGIQQTEENKVKE